MWLCVCGVGWGVCVMCEMCVCGVCVRGKERYTLFIIVYLVIDVLNLRHL